VNKLVEVPQIDNKVRIGEPSDFQELFRICCLLHAENGSHSFNELKVREIIWRAVNRDGGIVAVIGPHDDIKAMLLLTIDEIFYSDEQVLNERWHFVRPDCRRSDFAKQMIKFAKKCADETGLMLYIGIISEKQLEAKRRLYERLLPLGGYWFTHRPSVQEGIR
jgi:hypothetical protein